MPSNIITYSNIPYTLGTVHNMRWQIIDNRLVTKYYSLKTEMSDKNSSWVELLEECRKDLIFILFQTIASKLITLSCYVSETPAYCIIDQTKGLRWPRKNVKMQKKTSTHVNLCGKWQ